MTTDRTPMTDLPDRIVVGANGAYWRDYGDSYSMCPVSEDNDPVEVVATYVRAEPRAEGLDVERDLQTLAKLIATDWNGRLDEALAILDKGATLPPRPTQYRRGFARGQEAAAIALRAALVPEPETGS